MDLKLFDKRVVMRNIEKGVVSKSEYHKHIKALEDLSDQCEELDVSMSDDDREKEGSDSDDSAPGEEVD